jgi:hypothetical protein
MNISITVDKEILSEFSRILRKGIKVEGNVGMSLGDFLRTEVGMSPEYIEGRIQTIFLNGSPVDNVEAAVVEDGDTLALSASMPGLVGVSMRKGGHLARFRSEISYDETRKAKGTAKGRVIIKLFNLLAREMAPLFLERGVIVDGEELAFFFDSQNETVRAALKSIEIDGKAAEIEKLKEVDWAQREVFLRVRVLGSTTGNGRKDS